MQVCNRCVMDTTDPKIIFDENGYCNHCTNALNRLKGSVYGLAEDKKSEKLAALLSEIKEVGKNNKFDCIVGLSGGVDSTYTLYLLKQWGLRPFVIHADNHWNSEIAEENILNASKHLDIPVERVVVDWNEFRDVQLAFLRSSTPDSEVPSDNLIFAVLYKYARDMNIKYIMAGYNNASESILAKEWSQGHYDKKYIKTIHRKFGDLKSFSFPTISEWNTMVNSKFRGINVIKTLDYISYNKDDARNFIEMNLGWKSYGRKHGESNYTKIFQEYILPRKFGFDKRKAHYSSLIVANQLTRSEALNLLNEPLYESDEAAQKDVQFLCEKLGITLEEFTDIMNRDPQKYSDYPNMEKMFSYKLLKWISNRKKRRNLI